MYRIFYFVAFVTIILAGVKISNVITTKFKINRWILAFAAPLTILVPLIVFKSISPWVLNILIAIFSIESIMFFEITRDIMAKHEKEAIRYRNKPRKK
ncbi:hypothetical protein [Clostridium brassicae]|uniref:DUF4491 family protein n=1 Tax=Clostridium brassicae TaxID=2999072 RepID=A0ABT4DCL9_9CLOT|nr:hypothetical protein [Clostridium brassicae]MCY6960059.1 hypothetical protein [Clostridium brassicae]